MQASAHKSPTTEIDVGGKNRVCFFLILQQGERRTDNTTVNAAASVLSSLMTLDSGRQL